MKLKALWIEYIINPLKKKDGGSCYVLTWRTSTIQHTVNFHGEITEEEIKNLLSQKQFNEWKAGKRNSFIKHLTVEERKNILKKNNQKKDD